MTPIFLLSTIALPTCLAGAYGLREYPIAVGVLVAVGILPILMGCAAYAWFGIKDPDRLHSEEYNLRSQALKIVEAKGGPVPVNPVELQGITDPYPPQKQLPAPPPPAPKAEDDKGGDDA
jgi:hypothetical protein